MADDIRYALWKCSPQRKERDKLHKRLGFKELLYLRSGLERYEYQKVPGYVIINLFDIHITDTKQIHLPNDSP